MLPNAQQPPVGHFVPWESAQAASLDRSKAAAQAIAKELRKKDLSVATLGLPIRPLNNVVAPAIAVELALENKDPLSSESAMRRADIVSAIASAVVQLRGQTGARP